MGSILNSKIVKDKIIFSVCMDQKEALQLKGHVNDIHIFSEHVADIRTNLSGRGKNSATKYFLVPKELRKDIKFQQSKQISCQRLDTKEHVIFVYLVNKIPYKKIMDLY
jgi:superfamily II RNA helicase